MEIRERFNKLLDIRCHLVEKDEQYWKWEIEKIDKALDKLAKDYPVLMGGMYDDGENGR